jgi:hypothetical protein
MSKVLLFYLDKTAVIFFSKHGWSPTGGMQHNAVSRLRKKVGTTIQEINVARCNRGLV